MKRIFSLVCLFAVLLSSVSCSSALQTAQPTEADSLAETKEAVASTTEEVAETGPIVYPEGFSVGYARVDITPKEPMKIYNGTGNSTHDPLMLTCTAVCDGEGVALLFSVDTKNINVEFANDAMKLLEEKFGIPADRIMLNVTHTHSAPDLNTTGSAITNWKNLVFKQMVICVDKALRDLDPAEAYAGKGYTDGITFVRRYFYKTTSKGTDPYAHESEADNELRTIRFDRKNKKDVLMINYQTHYGGGKYKNQYSADFINPYRKTVEKDLDMLFVYYSGASGNLNFNSEIPKERKYADYVKAIDGFMITTKEALSKEEKLETGKIISSTSLYPGKIGQDTPERIAQAQEIMSYPENSAEYQSALGKYGMASREAEGINRRSKKDKIVDVPFTAISFGDIGFASAPYEMFDTNGKEVRNGSPFKMTFVLSYTNGGFGYVPSALAFPNKGYEVYITWFAEGSAEEFSGEMVRLLNVCNSGKN